MADTSERRDQGAIFKLEWRPAWAGVREPEMAVLEPFRHLQVQLAPWEPGDVSVDVWGLGNFRMTVAQARHLALALTMAADRSDQEEARNRLPNGTG